MSNMPGANNQNQSSPFEIVTSAKSKKSGKKGWLIAILVVVFLALSVVAGVILVRQRQQVAEKAQVVQPTPAPNTVTFPKAGTIRIYYHDFTNDSPGESFGPMTVTFTNPVGQTSSATLPGGPLTGTATMQLLDTDINVTAGQQMTIKSYYGPNNTTFPGFGWLAPAADGTCGPKGQAHTGPLDAWATSQAQGEPFVSQECWADSTYGKAPDASTYDYNDFYIILSYVPAASTETASPSPTTEATVSPSPSGSTTTTTSPNRRSPLRSFFKAPPGLKG